jgi:hypothetical protein
MSPSRRQLLPAVVLLAVLATVTALSASAAPTTAAPGGDAPAPTLRGFRKVMFLSHVNDPATTPGFPGDPAFSLQTAFTVPQDGYYLQYVK